MHQFFGYLCALFFHELYWIIFCYHVFKQGKCGFQNWKCRINSLPHCLCCHCCPFHHLQKVCPCLATSTIAKNIAFPPLLRSPLAHVTRTLQNWPVVGATASFCLCHCRPSPLPPLLSPSHGSPCLTSLLALILWSSFIFLSIAVKYYFSVDCCVLHNSLLAALAMALGSRFRMQPGVLSMTPVPQLQVQCLAWSLMIMFSSLLLGSGCQI